MAFVDRIFQSETLPVLEAGMGFAHQKHLVIMNNIANVETPHYKRQSLPEGPFQKSLREAIYKRETQHPGRLDLQPGLDVRFHGTYPHMRMFNGNEAGPERHDENSVVIEREMADLAKNQLKMSAMQRLYKKKLDLMRASLRDRPS